LFLEPGIVHEDGGVTANSRATPGDWDPEPMIKEWTAGAGKGKEMAYAESFRVVTLVSDEDFAKMMEKETADREEVKAAA
jgi:hypothetical protein